MSTATAQDKRNRAESGAPPVQSYSFRCFVYSEKSTGLYVAECIDLDIMVKAENAEMAKTAICNAVAGHAHVAFETGEVETLLHRPSPWSHRLHYQFARLLANLPWYPNLLFFKTPSCQPAQS